MKKRPEVSDSEILHYMDFDALLHKHDSIMQANRYKLFLKRGLLLVGGIALITLLWFSVPENQKLASKPAEQEPALAQQPVEPPAPVDNPALLNDGQETEKEPKNRITKSKPVTEAIHGKREISDKETIAQPEYIYQQSSPIDGYAALYQYFSSALQYPTEAIADSVQGVVTVSFIINVSGNPEKITIENSPDEKLNQEAIRLIENMPLWNPATLNGNPVSSKLSIPITFQIISVKSKE